MPFEFKKYIVLIGSSLACYGVGISADVSPKVTSQGGPNGVTSIGAQPTTVQPSTTATIPSTTAKPIDQTALLLQLQQQVNALQSQLKQVQTTQTKQSSNNSSSSNSSQFTTYSSKVGERGKQNQDTKSSQGGYNITDNISADGSILNMNNKALGGVFSPQGGIDVGGQPIITSQGQASFMGSYTGNNSIPIGQISSSLFSSTLLGQREKFDDYSIFFGAKINIDAQAWSGSDIKEAESVFRGNGQNIYLTAANLYFLSNIGHYVTVQFDFDTDESGNFGIGNAFAIFGNLDTSPFFVTAGRNKMSVGAFGGGNVYTGGLSGNFASGTKTNVSVNYKTDTINTNIAVFGSDDHQANASAGFFYADQLTQDIGLGFNTGYVLNVAGADNSGIAQVLADNGRTGDMAGMFNLDTNVSYEALGGQFQASTGWTTMTSAQNYNGDGIDSLAGTWYLGGAYGAILGGRSTSFQVTYAQTYNSAAVPMAITSSPIAGQKGVSGIENQLAFGAQRAYFDDNVVFGPEYSYQKLYNGEHMNTFTLDLLVYV